MKAAQSPNWDKVPVLSSEVLREALAPVPREYGNYLDRMYTWKHMATAVLDSLLKPSHRARGLDVIPSIFEEIAA